MENARHLNTYGNKNMDSQDWNVDSLEGTEDIQSGNSSEIRDNKSEVGGNEDMNRPDVSQKKIYQDVLLLTVPIQATVI